MTISGAMVVVSCSAYREDLMMAKCKSEILHPKGYLYWAESHEEQLKREESESII